MRLWLAPLHGITLYHFRNCLYRHTKTIKTAITPFLPIQEVTKLRVKRWTDVLPENNQGMKIIPQLMGNNPTHFVDTVRALMDLGYEQINWNIGCPAAQITRKKRGCGLMPYPQMVEDVVRLTTQQTSCHLSLKMRLGLYDASESLDIIHRINNYPLDFLVIHPRLGIQQYEGVPDWEAFEERSQMSLHPIVYSGDINSVEIFQQLSSRFPNIQDWMLGRGILQNPFLAEQIVAMSEKPTEDASPYSQRLINFYGDLIETLREHRNEKGALANLKELWHYLSVAFQLDEEEQKRIFRINELNHFIQETAHILNTKNNIYY